MTQRQTQPKSPRRLGLIVSGTHTSVGKSSIAAGLMRLLNRQGFRVCPFKIGPDYIDPGHHTRACGEPSYNLDSFMCSPGYIRRLYKEKVSTGGIAIVEGVMGLFDGAHPAKDKGSTAEVAKILDLPLLLIIDGQAMARSAAALVDGFLKFDPDLKILGVIANRVNHPGHARILKSSIEHYTKAKFLGYLPESPNLSIPSRHLGLVQGQETEAGLYDQWADHLEKYLDLKLLLKMTRKYQPADNSDPAKINNPRPLKRHTRSFTVAVARDEAFQFIYPDTLDLFERSGGKYLFFSPIRDKNIPSGADWIYIPGGYPELFSGSLSKNRSMLKALRTFGESGRVIVGECGGLMYLGKSILDEKGKAHSMAGLFDFSVSMSKQNLSLGYRKYKLNPSPGQGSSIVLKGHEFHYSQLLNNKETPLMVQTKPGNGTKISDGYKYKNCFAFYSHICWVSSPTWLKFVLHLANQNH